MSPNQSEKGNPLIKNRYKQGSLAKLPGKPSKGKRQLTDEERQARMGQHKFVADALAKYDWDRSGVQCGQWHMHVPLLLLAPLSKAVHAKSNVVTTPFIRCLSVN